jgi:hypothetical protein
VGVLGEKQLLPGRDRERVESEHDLTPEADAHHKHVTLSNDDAIQNCLYKEIL